MPSDPPDDNDAPELFTDAPTPDDTARDLRREITTIIHALADGDAIDFHHLSNDVTAGGFVAEGTLRKMLATLATDGAVDVVLAGDPRREHYRRPRAAADVAMLRAAMLALSGTPDDRRAPEDVGMSAFDVAALMTARGVDGANPITIDDVEPLLDALTQRGLVAPCQVKRDMPWQPTPEDGPLVDMFPQSVVVTVYTLAAGLTWNLLAPGFDALLGAAAPLDATDGTAASRASIAAAYAARITEATRARDVALQDAAAERRRADAAEATARRMIERLEARGLDDIVAEVTAPEPQGATAITATVGRGKPQPYEKRIPITVELKARFADEGKAIRREIARYDTLVANAKKNHEAVKTTGAEQIALLAQRLADMDDASDAGTYLLVVAQAERRFDAATRRTAIHDYATGEFITWDDPAALPVGAQTALPGTDVDPVVPPTKARRPRKATSPAPDDTDDAGDATGPTAPPPDAPTGNGGAPVVDDASDTGDAADVASAAEEAKRASAAAAVPTGTKVELRTSVIKDAVVAMVRGRRDVGYPSILWSNVDDKVTDDFVADVASHMGSATMAANLGFRTILVSAVRRLIETDSLVSTSTVDGYVLTLPAGAPAAPKPATDATKPAAPAGATPTAPRRRKRA